MTNLNGDSGELVAGNICPSDTCHRREPCPPEIRFMCEYEYDTPKENETPKSDLVEQLENCAIIFEGEPDLADIFIRALANYAELSGRVTKLRDGLLDARLFVDLLRMHWQNWHDDPEQVAEAADMLGRIDALLTDKGGE